MRRDAEERCEDRGSAGADGAAARPGDRLRLGRGPGFFQHRALHGGGGLRGGRRHRAGRRGGLARRARRPAAPGGLPRPHRRGGRALRVSGRGPGGDGEDGPAPSARLRAGRRPPARGLAPARPGGRGRPMGGDQGRGAPGEAAPGAGTAGGHPPAAPRPDAGGKALGPGGHLRLRLDRPGTGGAEGARGGRRGRRRHGQRHPGGGGGGTRRPAVLGGQPRPPSRHRSGIFPKEREYEVRASLQCHAEVLETRGTGLADSDLDAMEAAWAAVKISEKG